MISSSLVVLNFTNGYYKRIQLYVTLALRTTEYCSDLISMQMLPKLFRRNPGWPIERFIKPLIKSRPVGDLYSPNVLLP